MKALHVTSETTVHEVRLSTCRLFAVLFCFYYQLNFELPSKVFRLYDDGLSCHKSMHEYLVTKLVIMSPFMGEKADS